MSYKVTAALVIIPNADGKSGDWYGYDAATVPLGLNDERCDQLVKEGMLAKVKSEKSEKSDAGNTPPAPDELDITASANKVLEWVGTDKDCATAALEAEKSAKGDKSRAGLVKELDAVLAAEAS